MKSARSVNSFLHFWRSKVQRESAQKTSIESNRSSEPGNRCFEEGWQERLVSVVPRCSQTTSASPSIVLRRPVSGERSREARYMQSIMKRQLKDALEVCGGPGCSRTTRANGTELLQCAKFVILLCPGKHADIHPGVRLLFM